MPGIAQEQQARVRALALADGTVRPVIEANVINVAGGSSVAYTVLVDAVSGKILVRQNKVDNLEYNNVFAGCDHGDDLRSACTRSTLTDNLTKTIVATATGSPANDFTLKVFQGVDPAHHGRHRAPTRRPPSSPTRPASPPAPTRCRCARTTPPCLPPFNYVASVSTSNSGAPSAGTGGPQPKWRFFTTNPSLTTLGASTPTNSVVGCWFTQAGGCSYPLGPLKNVQAPGPWDTLAATGITTGTTVGNNANTHEAWASPLTPGGTFQAPVSATRDYTQPFTDAWNNSKCGLEELVPGGNDINASVTDLFVTHNLMHDYSYYLGFTEANYNLQLQNLGRGGVEGDQEIGNAQAGAIGGAQTGLGRDNANQIAMQDGIPGITNQYLFQPLAGGFYAPCTDGSLDFGIVGHEYTHAISNRMVGGPDEGLTSEQGGAMGESWSDLNAAEYQFSHGLSNGGNIFAVGVYATQNKTVAIRDYAINKNPLNYSDYGFDSPGPEVHADGEIWNGTQWSVRQALVKKWNKKFPYSNKTLQKACSTATATGSPRSATQCPGNRRWIQLVFDSFLLQQGATSMLDARDAMLAADKMRFGGKDLKVMWGAFAGRGMGKGASVKNGDDTDPKPSFATPKGKNAKVTFKTKSQGLVFVGDYEARVSPVADTNPKTKLKNTVKLAPGKYKMLYVGKTRGFTRFNLKVKAGQTKVVKLKDQKNLASKYTGAKVIGFTPGSRNVDALIDNTEKTNWAGVTEGNVDATKPFVAVDLAGKVSKIRKFNVSAYLNPAPAQPDGHPARGRPGLGLAVHRTAPVRPRGVREELRVLEGQVEAGLHVQAEHLPGRSAATGGSRPEPAVLQAQEGREGGGGATRRAREPVHRVRRVRRRAGQRPAERHRLQDGVRPGHDRARGRAPGLRQGAARQGRSRLSPRLPPGSEAIRCERSERYPRVGPGGRDDCEAREAGERRRGPAGASSLGSTASSGYCSGWLTPRTTSLGWRNGRTYPCHGRHACRRPRTTAGQGDRR